VTRAEWESSLDSSGMAIACTKKVRKTYTCCWASFMMNGDVVLPRFDEMFNALIAGEASKKSDMK